MTEVRDRLLEDLNAFNMKKEKFEKPPLKKEVAMIAMTRSLLDFERIMNHLETKKRF